MNRLTHKRMARLKEGEFISLPKEEYREVTHNTPSTEDLYKRLGLYENLMEQYNINDFDELEKALAYYKNRNNKFIFGFGE